MRLLKNREVKIIILGTAIASLIFAFGGGFLIKNWFNQSNSIYTKQNVAIVGAILKENPELEEKIIPIVTKGQLEKDYEYGLEIMSKYSYSDIEVNRNIIIKEQYNNFKITWIAFILAFFLMIVSIILYAVTPIFNRLRYLQTVADNMMEGKFENGDLVIKEGEFSIFYTKFTDMGLRLENAMKELKSEKVNLKDIINDISHQLKTPLAALITYNDILKNHENMDLDTKNKFINLCSEQLDRMEWLIATLLKYARIESDAVIYNKEKISMIETIQYAVSPLRVKSNEKNISINIIKNGSCEYVHDKKWISEAIGNIVKNAIEHTNIDGNIDISLEETALSLEIKIKDNGCGIEKEELKNIFKRFYKGKGSINPTSIGIGLSLSKKIIEAHGGNIQAESEVGVGTTFYINFLKGVV